MVNKKLWAGIFTLSGTIIGAGVLGLPYVFAKSGFLISFSWILFLGFIMIYTYLCLGEVQFRTKGTHQLVGYAEKYLGKKGKWLMFFATLFGVYAALIAYLLGEGQSFSSLFFGNTNFALYFGVGFWIFMTLLSHEGLKGLKKFASLGVITIILILIFIIGVYSPEINFINFLYSDFSNLFFPFGVVLFALLGFTAIPEVKRVAIGNEKDFKKMVILGVLIPVVIYILFGFVFLGVLGKNVQEVATLSFGIPVILFGIFTMMTCYFVLSFALRDIFVTDLKLSKFPVWFLSSFLPLILYLAIQIFGLADFVNVLSFGGVISGGLTGILVLILSLKAKKKSELKPIYKMKLNWWITGLISLVFILGVIFELL